MGTYIVGALLIGIVYLVIRSMVRNKKNGNSLHCGTDCKHCSGHCNIFSRRGGSAEGKTHTTGKIIFAETDIKSYN